MSTITVYLGENEDIMNQLHIDGIVVDSIVTDPPAGIGFMSKSWDTNRGNRTNWINWLSLRMNLAMQLVKPGGHSLVWSLPRTSHWTGVALENAGWELRDCIINLFGKGFPKGQDLGKMIDRKFGKTRKIISVEDKRSMYDGKKRKSKATNSNYRKLEGRKDIRDVARHEISEPVTEEAKQWTGWNTVLKPAYEQWWLCRKPLSEKTITNNVLKHGTGAINIETCRIGDDSNSKGRYPSNVTLSHHIQCDIENMKCHSECPVKMLDDQSGILKSGYSSGKRNKPKTKDTYGKFKILDENPSRPANQGGASRFFYSSKVSPKDRMGTNHPTSKNLKLMEYLCKLITPQNGLILDPFAGSGSLMVTALRYGYDAILIEKEKEYFDMILERSKWMHENEIPLEIINLENKLIINTL